VPSTAKARVATAAKARSVLVCTTICRVGFAINVRTGSVQIAVVNFSRARLAFIDIFTVECARGVFASTHLEVAIMGIVRALVDICALENRSHMGVALIAYALITLNRGRAWNTVYTSAVLVTLVFECAGFGALINVCANPAFLPVSIAAVTGRASWTIETITHLGRVLFAIC
jgi:hypothetical protein